MKRISSTALILIAAVQIFSQNRDYPTLHNLLIKFYGYQRAGLKSGDCYNLNPGYQAGYHKNDNYNNNALDAGWYDAGDYIKFGMNLGYTVYCLLKGYDIVPNAYDDKYKWDHSNGADNIPDILNQVKFATDYMAKAVIDENTIVLDVGRAQDEHGALSDPVANPNGRSGSQILLCSGADIPLTYAACLALMSTVYRKFDAAYADQCLTKAITAFKFGKKKVDQGGDNNLFCTPQLKGGSPLYDYYKEDGKYAGRVINDRQVAAGVELYRATLGTDKADPVFRQWAQRSIVDVSNCMGYAYIGPLASIEVWRQQIQSSAGALMANANFLKTKIKSSGKFNGVYQNSGWGTAREIGSAAFEFALAYVAAATEATKADFLDLAKKHVDWVAYGSQSYIVGFGTNPPKNIHYRPTRSGPPGGLISGPDGDGNWQDNGDAKFCEVAIDYNAGLIGAVALLRAVQDPGDAVKVNSAFTADKKADIDLNSGSVKLSATFSKSVVWTIKIVGSYGEKSYTGTGTSISQTWDGTADKGYFLGGEAVKANLTLSNANIIIYDIQKAMPVTMELAAVKKIPSSNGDITIDDFEDGNLDNKIGGAWVANGTGSGLLATRVSVDEDEGSKALTINANCNKNGHETFSGVRTTFNSSGSPSSIGKPKSIAFNLKASVPMSVYVELEQSNITDSAYFCAVIPALEKSNQYRVNISDLKQPDWKKSDATLDLSKIVALRFTVYDSVGRQKINLDNVAIEDFSTGTAPASMVKPDRALAFKPVFSNGTLTYSIPRDISGTLNIAVYDISGKMIMNRTVNARAGATPAISFSRISDGIYTVIHTVNGKVTGEKMKITHVN